MNPIETPNFAVNLGLRKGKAEIFKFACLASTVVGLIMLSILLFDIAGDGSDRINATFLEEANSSEVERAGINPAVLGSVWVIGLTVLLAVPVGVGAAIYLEEYARPSPIKSFIEINIANLAGVPSIVFGILGLTLFVREANLGKSILAGSLTMALLILPVIIIAGREALRAVPQSLRQAAFGVGATRWQCIWGHVLPSAIPGILTGVILAVSRAIGETAPLIMVGAAMVRFAPETISDSFIVLPYQVYYWTGLPQEEWQHMAAAAIIILLGILLLMNTVAINIRIRAEADSRWLRSLCDMGFIGFALPVGVVAVFMVFNRPIESTAYVIGLAVAMGGAVVATFIARNPRHVATAAIVGGIAVAAAIGSVILASSESLAVELLIPVILVVVGTGASLGASFAKHALSQSDSLLLGVVVAGAAGLLLGATYVDTLALIGFILLAGSLGMAAGGVRSLIRTAKTPK